MHYSQQPSAVNSTLELGVGNGADVLRVRLQGFIDDGELGERMDALLDRLRRETPNGLLCDLRPVTGYGPTTPVLARDGLTLACRVGVRRVALIVHSSVVRTAAELFARNLYYEGHGLGLGGGRRLELRCFVGEPEALRWLDALAAN